MHVLKYVGVDQLSDFSRSPAGPPSFYSLFIYFSTTTLTLSNHLPLWPKTITVKVTPSLALALIRTAIITAPVITVQMLPTKTRTIIATRMVATIIPIQMEVSTTIPAPVGRDKLHTLPPLLRGRVGRSSKGSTSVFEK